MTMGIADTQEKVMNACHLVSPYRSAEPAAYAAHTKSSRKRPIGARLQKSARACAPDLMQNLHEDLAQTLCAIKFYLEGLSQNELPGAHIASSIAALQSAIRQLSSLAVRADPPSLPAPTRPFHKRRYPAFLETRPGGI